MKEHDNNDPARRQLEEFMAKHGLRRTQERFAMLEVATKFRNPFTVAEIRARSASDGHQITDSTAYSCLQLLVEAGLLRRVDIPGQPRRFEVIGDEQSRRYIHLVCDVCGRIKDVRDPDIDRLIQNKRFSSFTTSHYSLTVFGRCRACGHKRPGTK